MQVTWITDRLAVAKQPALGDFMGLARQGFAAVVNNRPDGEEAGQPGSAAEEVAAHAAGLDYEHIPITAKSIDKTDVRRLQEVLNRTDGPVFAHCKSGTRSLTLWVIGEVLDGQMRLEDVRAFGERHGFDLKVAEAWLAEHGTESALRRRSHQRPEVKTFFDERTFSLQYVIHDPVTMKGAIIDPVLDFDEKSGATATKNADAILAYVVERGIEIEWILDTHPHADHFSAAQYLKVKTGAPTAIGQRVVDVQKLWRNIYNWPDFPADGSQWDKLFADGERFLIGNLEARVMFSPGHTLASITYVIGDAAFVHDTLFMPDGGTARADFPGGSAKDLWRSIQAILALPVQTRLFTGHDYQPNGREPRWESTISAQKQQNEHVAGKDEATFVQLRNARDKTLSMPKLILPSLQVNIRGGSLPEPEGNGRRYLKIPLDALPGAAWDDE